MTVNYREKLVNGKKTLCGEVVYRDVKFTFAVHRASAQKADYKYVLRTNVIDPSTCKILQQGEKVRRKKIKKLKERIAELEADGSGKNSEKLSQLNARKERLQSGERMDELNASSSRYLVTNDWRSVREALEIVVPKLYGQYSDEIHGSLKELPSVTDIHSLTAYDMYQNAFFNNESAVSPKRLREKKAALRHVCEGLDNKAISKLTAEDVARMAETLKGDVRGKLNCAERFFAFCGEHKVFSGPNPVTLFKVGSKIKKTGKPIHPKEISHIESVEEIKLHEVMEMDLFEDLGLAVPLAKGARMSISRMLELQWKDIIIDDTGVRIQDYKDQYSGGTNNYIRPPTRETAKLIKKKYSQLVTQYGQPKLRSMRVLTFSGKVTETEMKAKVTKHVHDVLRSAGITREQISAAADPYNPKKAGGAGISLLHKHYDYALKEFGKININSGVGLFLRGMRIYDTTTGSYRCLNDESGNAYLQVVMRRIDVVVRKENAPRPILSEKRNGTREVRVAASGHGIRTGVTSKKAFRVPKGTCFCVQSGYGVKGTVRFFEALDEKSRELEYQAIC